MHLPFTIKEVIQIFGTLLIGIDIIIKSDTIKKWNNILESIRQFAEHNSAKLFKLFIYNKYFRFIFAIELMIIVLLINNYHLEPNAEPNASYLTLGIAGVILGVCVFISLPTLLVVAKLIQFISFLISRSQRGIIAFIGLFLLILSYFLDT